ncbi:MAG: PqqD family protein [Oscillospiraceae bacterium]
MKIADGFIIKSIADTNIVVPVGSNSVTFKAIISLNDTGAFLWRLMKNDITEEELVSSMLEEYDVDEKTAQADVSEFLKSMQDSGLIQ